MLQRQASFTARNSLDVNITQSRLLKSLSHFSPVAWLDVRCIPTVSFKAPSWTCIAIYYTNGTIFTAGFVVAARTVGHSALAPFYTAHVPDVFENQSGSHGTASSKWPFVARTTVLVGTFETWLSLPKPFSWVQVSAWECVDIHG